MLPLVTECFLLAPDRVSWSCSEPHIVTEPCDKLAAQEHFLGNNAMSKQAQCCKCCSDSLSTMTKVDNQGNHTWGALCCNGHWGPTVNHPRDFTSDEYGQDVYRELCIPPNTPM
eukprot:2825508-Rhodomonas_salina.1